MKPTLKLTPKKIQVMILKKRKVQPKKTKGSKYA